MHVRSASLRVMIGALALLLVASAGFGSLVAVKNASAKSACTVILLCPSPTPSPIPGPTPTSGPIPGPTPTSGPVPGPTPTKSEPTPAATAAASVSPTVTSPGISHLPVPSPTSSSTLMGRDDKNQPLGQFGSGTFSQMLTIAVVIFLFLLFSLGIGLFLFRRTLLPSIDMRLPSRGTGSWSLTGVPQAFVRGTTNKKKRW